MKYITKYYLNNSEIEFGDEIVLNNVKTIFTQNLYNENKSSFNSIIVDENNKIDLLDFIMYKHHSFLNQKNENQKNNIHYDVILGFNKLKFKFNTSLYYLNESFNVNKCYVKPDNINELKNKLKNYKVYFYPINAEFDAINKKNNI